MPSFAVPCPKVSPPAASDLAQKRHRIANFPPPESGFTAPPAIVRFQVGGRSQSNVFKVAAEKISNPPSTSIAVPPVKESQNRNEIPDATSLSAIMKEASDLIKFVHSRDIVELQLKQIDCEIHIKKKEALAKPSHAPPVYLPPPPQAPPPQMPPANAPASAGSASSTPAPAPAPAPAPPKPAPRKAKSSRPPFKSPMAGTFYHAPSPSAPPYVKVGDKVQRGQILCIIEAMKLMNEIEADQGGTVVEILAENGKSISIDTPLFIIEP